MAHKRDGLDEWLDDRRAEHRNRTAVLERAAALGIQAQARPGFAYTKTVAMTAEQLAAICDRLERENA